MTRNYLTEAVNWCAEHDLVFDLVNANCDARIQTYGGDCRKLSADLYIDDRGLVDVWSEEGRAAIAYHLGRCWGPGSLVAVDFDGTLCRDAYPDIGEPNTQLIEALRLFRACGGRLALWTCRRDERQAAPEPPEPVHITYKDDLEEWLRVD